MFIIELLGALFTLATIFAGTALVVADLQARRAPAREESRAWRRPRL